ncbi:MAG TPA: PepSY domain-containing protein [Flavisolibacter sp.]
MRSNRFYIRKTHRYLGVVLGIQFLVWTISGLYFSWTNLDEIHGDFQRRQSPMLTGNYRLVSPQAAFEQLTVVPDSLHTVQLVSVLGKPFYSIRYFAGGRAQVLLADAQTGIPRDFISKDEAIKIAAESFAGTPDVRQVAYLTSTHGHHEYREKPLPAWAVSFGHHSGTTVYVSAETGRVESFRNSKWRVFDFLWMGHTMDYESRDNINNWLLRIFSAFGLLTVLSGFVLFFASRRRRRVRTRRLHPPLPKSKL